MIMSPTAPHASTMQTKQPVAAKSPKAAEGGRGGWNTKGSQRPPSINSAGGASGQQAQGGGEYRPLVPMYGNTGAQRKADGMNMRVGHGGMTGGQPMPQPTPQSAPQSMSADVRSQAIIPQWQQPGQPATTQGGPVTDEVGLRAQIEAEMQQQQQARAQEAAMQQHQAMQQAAAQLAPLNMYQRSRGGIGIRANPGIAQQQDLRNNLGLMAMLQQAGYM